MQIPTEARATIAAFRDGVTLRQYLNFMWARRAVAHPSHTKSTGTWPTGAWSAWRASLKAKPTNLRLVRKGVP